MIRIEKILVPTDNSSTSLKALEYAVEIGQFQKAVIYLVHVVDERYLSYMSLTDDGNTSTPNLENKMEIHMTKELTEIIKNNDLDKKDRIQVVTKILVGRPCEEIINFSDKEDVDLIVMGTHGDSGLRRMLIGSVAERVVRPDEHEFIHGD